MAVNHQNAGRPSNGRRPSQNTKRPSQNGRRPSSPNARRRRKNKNNNYLYIALALCIIGLALFGFMVFELASGPDAPADTSGIEESRKPEESKPADKENSTPVSSDNSAPVSKPQPDESDEVSTPPAEPVIPTSTKEYEEFIGVKYAIDMSEYEKFVCPENEADFVYLVNPKHTLASDYKPPNLVWCSNIRKGRPEAWSYIDGTANEALEAFLKEAAHYGYDDITVTNAYRSYNSQASLFNGYVEKDLAQDYYCDTCKEYIDVTYERSKVSGGKCVACETEVRRPTKEETTAHVLTYSTRPGTSEHQSGLCCDMHNLPDTTSAFDNTPEAKWLADNAHRFGFILRYPPNTQHITGIKHESWHFRYVGRTAATEMYQKGLTLEEYLGDYPVQ